MRYTKQWAQDNGVPMWIGESGVSRYLSGTTDARPAADRAEFTAFVRETALGMGVPVCYWGYNSAFAQYDQKAGAWLPGMLRAVTALPAPIPIRPTLPFIALFGGRITRAYNPATIWAGFSYDPVTGVLTAPANTTGVDQTVQIVFPEIPVAADQSWLARSTAFTGNWRLSAAAFYYDPLAKNRNGVAGLDQRAVNAAGQGLFPPYRQRAPGGVSQPFTGIVSPAPYLAMDVAFEAGSAAGFIRFSRLQDL